MLSRSSFYGSSETSSADSVIDSGMQIIGIVQITSSMLINAKFSGKIIATPGSPAEVIIGPKGHIEGDIEGKNVIIEGLVNGNITSTGHLCLRRGSCVKGNISYALLSIVPGAVVTGKVYKRIDERTALPLMNSTTATS